MKKQIKFSLIIIFFTTLSAMSQVVNVNPDPNGIPWMAGDAIPLSSEDHSLIPVMRLSPEAQLMILPDTCDNSNRKFMPPVFSQGTSGCCVQASEIWYCFTYEINRLRDVNGGRLKAPGDTAFWQNQYHPFFTYNFLNKGNGSSGTGSTSGFTIARQIGIPSYDIYWDWALDQDSIIKYLYWMTGYEKYEKGSRNRVKKVETIIWNNNFLSLDTLKHWLADHNSNSTEGGLAEIGVPSIDFPIGYLPPESPHANQRYLLNWGSSGGHAMTIVGYDDNICCFDLNNDGIYSNFDQDGDGILELSECEKGAFKIVNSWGTDWGNIGYIWAPYRLFGTVASAPHYAYKCEVEEGFPTMALEMQIEYPKRAKLSFKPAYGITSCQTQSIGNTYYNSPYYNGGYNNMRGAYLGPIEMSFAYSTIYNVDNIAKIFLKIHEVDTTTVHSAGTVNYFSLIDRRWNEEFELPMKIISPITLVDNDTTALAINYYLLPHHNEHITNEYRVTCDRVSRFTTEVEAGGTLRFMEGSQYDDLNVDMYNSIIHIKDTSSIIFGQYNKVTAKRGNCQIIVDGNISVQKGLKLKAEEGATLELVIRKGAKIINDTLEALILDNAKLVNYSNKMIVSGCNAFNNSKIQSYGGNVSISGSGFEESNIRLENFLSDTSAKATVKDVVFGGNNNNSLRALFVYNYSKYDIRNNIIADYNSGIQLMLCGNGTSGNQIINNNQIYGHTLAGVIAYNTTGKFSGLNKIYNNGYGVQFFNKCLITLEGNSLATDISQTQQIYDNASFELYATQLGFPTYCRYNYISDTNNGGNPNDPIVYYDNDVNGSYQLVDVSRNCWGANFYASQDLKINNGYIQFIPFWCPGGGGGNPTSNLAGQLYNTALAYADSGMCVIASSYYKEVIDQYPQSEYAMPAMKQLYHIEQCAGGHYDSLSGYFLGNGSIINDSSLAFLGRYLSNECSIAQQDWPAAIAWYEDQITHPYSPEDSLFALIDLEHLYIIMENSGLKQAVVGNLAYLKPKSNEQFFQDADYYLSLLPFKKDDNKEQYPKLTELCKLEQNTPNPFNSTTTIKYSLSQSAIVKLVITDITGRVLFDKNEGNRDKGNYTVTLNNLKLEAGNYLYSIFLNDKLFDTKKMTIIK